MVNAGWFADPKHRHRVRYWDGRDWTTWVADSGLEYDEASRGTAIFKGWAPIAVGLVGTALVASSLLLWSGRATHDGETELLAGAAQVGFALFLVFPAVAISLTALGLGVITIQRGRSIPNRTLTVLGRAAVILGAIGGVAGIACLVWVFS